MRKRLFRYDDVFDESMAQFYISEMVLAIHALHNMGYVHRLAKNISGDPAYEEFVFEEQGIHLLLL